MKTPLRAALVAALALTLAACSGGDSNAPQASSSAAATSQSATSQAPESPSGDTYADSLTVTDAWAKAAETGMTAAFGSIANSSASDITIVSAVSPSASMVELHEVVDEVMRPVEGGFVIPAGETLMLEPGGYHLMFMGVTAPIVAGDDVTVTLTLDDGSELTFTAVAKDFAGANEDYDGGMNDAGMSAEPSDGMEG